MQSPRRAPAWRTFLWFHAPSLTVPGVYTAPGIFKSGNVCCSSNPDPGASWLLVLVSFSPLFLFPGFWFSHSFDSLHNKCSLLFVGYLVSEIWFDVKFRFHKKNYSQTSHVSQIIFWCSQRLTHATVRHRSACFCLCLWRKFSGQQGFSLGGLLFPQHFIQKV